jgi:hypothetical protein
MTKLPDTVRGKVFCHPATKNLFGPIRFPTLPDRVSTREGQSLEVLAEDVGGNYFAAGADGVIWFWDHETDDLEKLAGNVQDFVAACVDPPGVELDDLKKVKRVWIDPAFAKAHGIKLPVDNRRKSKP